MKLLLIKTSSLGDLVHCFPALTDAQAALPNLRVDWVAEENLCTLPLLHPAVQRVIPFALRRWRKTPFAKKVRSEFHSFKQALGQGSYDLVLDAQCLLKSAWITRLAQAPSAGLDWRSAREPLASLFYQHRYTVARELHAITRNRLLFAQALGYRLANDAPVHYGVNAQTAAESKTILCLHGTARAEKEWPEEHWIALANQLTQAGLTPVFPAGSSREAERAARIVSACFGATQLPSMSLADLIPQLQHSRAIIGVDTGLLHLGAALRKPCIGIYTATNPAQYGALAEPSAPPIINLHNSPSPQAVLNAFLAQR